MDPEFSDCLWYYLAVFQTAMGASEVAPAKGGQINAIDSARHHTGDSRCIGIAKLHLVR